LKYQHLFDKCYSIFIKRVNLNLYAPNMYLLLKKIVKNNRLLFYLRKRENFNDKNNTITILMNFRKKKIYFEINYKIIF
jgi:hypothetical protein